MDSHASTTDLGEVCMSQIDQQAACAGTFKGCLRIRRIAYRSCVIKRTTIDVDFAYRDAASIVAESLGTIGELQLARSFYRTTR